MYERVMFKYDIYMPIYNTCYLYTCILIILPSSRTVSIEDRQFELIILLSNLSADLFYRSSCPDKACLTHIDLDCLYDYPQFV